MEERVYLTKEGFENLKQELHHLKSKERPRISMEIAEAREKGDLRENAEYDAAKEAQGLLEMKINELENQLANAVVLEEGDVDISRVFILSTVRIKNLKNNAEMKYTIVSEKEADIKKSRISVDSPVGKGLLGKEVGDVVEIEVPAGKMKFEVLEITREF